MLTLHEEDIHCERGRPWNELLLRSGRVWAADDGFFSKMRMRNFFCPFSGKCEACLHRKKIFTVFYNGILPKSIWICLYGALARKITKVLFFLFSYPCFKKNNMMRMTPFGSCTERLFLTFFYRKTACVKCLKIQ